MRRSWFNKERDEPRSLRKNIVSVSQVRFFNLTSYKIVSVYQVPQLNLIWRTLVYADPIFVCVFKPI